LGLGYNLRLPPGCFIALASVAVETGVIVLYLDWPCASVLNAHGRGQKLTLTTSSLP
jgi:hypothetical protein